MGRQPCCDKVGLKKGPCTAEEDKKLISFILTNDQCCWRAVPKLAGLLRCGKSCRLRWTNYLRPDLKRGLLSDYEDKMVIDLHAQLGNRTDNEIKNHWNTHIKKKLKNIGIDPVTHELVPNINDQSQQHQKGEEEAQEQSRPPLENDENTPSHQTKEEIDSKNMGGRGGGGGGECGGDELEEMEPLIGGFCTDEVPLIEPHEILVPCAPSSSSSASSSSSSSSNNFLENVQFPDFEWPCDYNNNNNNDIDGIGLWDDELGSWGQDQSWAYGLL